MIHKFISEYKIVKYKTYKKAAFFNPTTKKYFYEPLLYDNEVPYVTVGTEITYYPSKRWEMLLIGISPDTEID